MGKEKKSLKSKLISKRAKIKRESAHFRAKFNRNHRYTLPGIKKLLNGILFITVILAMLFIFQMALTRLAIVPAYVINDLAKNLVIAQITIVSISTSIISLVASFDNKYIYGMRLNEALFRPLWLFRPLLFAPLLLALCNLWILISGYNDVAITAIFVISMVLMMVCVWKMLRVFLAPDAFKENLRRYYFKENRRQLLKARPLDSKSSQAMLSFRDITMQYVVNCSPEESENLNAYILLAEHSLSECKADVQAYYSESVAHNDFLAHISQFAGEMLYRGRYINGIRLYCQLYRLLNYYRVVNFSNHEMSHRLNLVAKSIRYIENEILAEEYQHSFVRLCEEQWLQKDIFLIDDFRTLRLSDMVSLYFVPDTLLSSYYVALSENTFLDEHAKSRLFLKLYDDIRMCMKFGVITEQNNDDFCSKDWWTNCDHFHRRYRNECFCMSSIALMILEIMNLGDTKRLALFSTIDFHTRSTSILKALCALSLVHHLARDCFGSYMLDLTISVSDSFEFLHDLDILSIADSKEDLLLVYKAISCCFCVEDDGSKEQRATSFHPRLHFEKNILDSFFLCLFRRLGDVNFFLEDIELNLSEDESIKSIVDKAIEYDG